jgi:hypothetical protein
MNGVTALNVEMVAIVSRVLDRSPGGRGDSEDSEYRLPVVVKTA